MELKSLFLRIKLLEEDLDEFLDQENQKYKALKEDQFTLEDENGGPTEKSEELRWEAREIEFFTNKFNDLKNDLWRTQHAIRVQIELDEEDEMEEEEE